MLPVSFLPADCGIDLVVLKQDVWPGSPLSTSVNRKDKNRIEKLRVEDITSGEKASATDHIIP